MYIYIYIKNITKPSIAWMHHGSQDSWNCSCFCAIKSVRLWSWGRPVHQWHPMENEDPKLMEKNGTLEI